LVFAAKFYRLFQWSAFSKHDKDIVRLQVESVLLNKTTEIMLNPKINIRVWCDQLTTGTLSLQIIHL
jgi:hypothetical protein